MRFAPAAAAFMLTILVGLSGGGAAFASPPPDGHGVAIDAQCSACHLVPDTAPPPRTASCYGCHQWVRTVAGNPAQRERALAIFPKWARYEKSVVSYFGTPDLTASFARLDPAWLRAYLADPYDLRPSLDESMVRLGLDAAQLDALCAWAEGYVVTPPRAPAPAAANVQQGARLFVEKGCVACHTFGTLHLGPGIPSAPDLRWARERMSDDMLAAWIQNPAAISPKATMPALGLTAAEALALRDYVVLADPDSGAPITKSTTSVADLPGPYTWNDVESRVFGKICVHCHMDPAQNEGRAGPGNAGGFGWPATGIELQTYEGVVANRELILRALARRDLEEGRDHVGPGQVPTAAPRPTKPGMPLGQPALSAADVRMIEMWFADGAPR